MNKALIPFSIPLLGLKQNFYSFDFQLDRDFFAAFEDSEVKDGNIQVKMELERKTGHIEMNFSFEGTVKTECDRCTAAINLPVEGEEQLIAKYSEEGQEDEDVIIYIHPDTPSINVAQYIYEYVNLAVPLSRVYDCENDENPPCDFSALDYLENQSENEEEDTTEEPNSAWDILKKFDKN